MGPLPEGGCGPRCGNYPTCQRRIAGTAKRASRPIDPKVVMMSRLHEYTFMLLTCARDLDSTMTFREWPSKYLWGYEPGRSAATAGGRDENNA